LKNLAVNCQKNISEIPRKQAQAAVLGGVLRVNPSPRTAKGATRVIADLQIILPA